MSETKPGMPSPALTEESVRRISREEASEAIRQFLVKFSIRLFDHDSQRYYIAISEYECIKYLPSWTSQEMMRRQATPTDQEGQDDTQAGSVDSVTAD